MKKVKHSLVAALCFVIISLFSACNFNTIESKNDYDNETKNEITETPEDPEELYSLSGSVATKGALPEAVNKALNSSFSENDARTASPAVPTSTITYIITASRNKNGTVKSVTTSCTSLSPNYTIQLAAADWSISVAGYLANTVASCSSTNLIFQSESKTINPATVTDASQTSFTVHPIIESGKTGSASLTVDIHDNSVIKSAVASWSGQQNGGTGFQTIDYSAATSATFDFNGAASVSTDIYTVTFKFYSGASATGSVVYSCKEIVNVFENMTTNAWVNTGTASYITDTGFKVNNTCVQAFQRSDFYVVSGTTYSSSAKGTTSSPFSYLTQAILYIKNNTGTAAQTKDMKIHVRGDINFYGSLSTTTAYTLEDFYNLIIVGETDTAGVPDDPVKISGKEKLTNKTNLTLKNVDFDVAQEIILSDSSTLTVSNSRATDGKITFADSLDTTLSSIYIDVNNSDKTQLVFSSTFTKANGDLVIKPVTGQTLSSEVCQKLSFYQNTNHAVKYDSASNTGVFYRKPQLFVDSNYAGYTKNGSKEYPFTAWPADSDCVEGDTVYLLADSSVSSISIQKPINVKSYRDSGDTTTVYNLETIFGIKTNTTSGVVSFENINLEDQSSSTDGIRFYGTSTESPSVKFKNCIINSKNSSGELKGEIINSKIVEFTNSVVNCGSYRGKGTSIFISTNVSCSNRFCLSASLSDFTSTTNFGLSRFDKNSLLKTNLIVVDTEASLTTALIPQPYTAGGSVGFDYFTTSETLSEDDVMFTYTGTQVLTENDLAHLVPISSKLQYNIIPNGMGCYMYQLSSDKSQIKIKPDSNIYCDSTNTATICNGSRRVPYKSLYDAFMAIEKNPNTDLNIFIISDEPESTIGGSFNTPTKNLKITSADETKKKVYVNVSLPSVVTMENLEIHPSGSNLSNAALEGGGTVVIKNCTYICSNSKITDCKVPFYKCSGNSGTATFTNVDVFGPETGLTKTTDGGAFIIEGSKTINLNNVNISNFALSGTAKGAGIYMTKGTLNYNGGTIKNCSTEADGGGIYAKGTSTFKDVTFVNCSAVVPSVSSGVISGGSNIYSDSGRISLSGTTHGEVDTTDSSYDASKNYSNDIAMNSTKYVIYDNYISITEPLTYAGSVISNLSLNNQHSSYPFALNTKALSGTSLTQDICNKFPVIYPGAAESCNWALVYDGTDGVISTSLTLGGEVANPLDLPVYFKMTSTGKKYSFTAYADAACTQLMEATDWTITVKYSGLVDTGITISADSTATCKNVDLSSCQTGSYQIFVTAKNHGLEFSENFVVDITL